MTREQSRVEDATVRKQKKRDGGGGVTHLWHGEASETVVEEAWKLQWRRH